MISRNYSLWLSLKTWSSDIQKFSRPFGTRANHWYWDYLWFSRNIKVDLVEKDDLGTVLQFTYSERSLLRECFNFDKQNWFLKNVLIIELENCRKLHDLRWWYYTFPFVIGTKFAYLMIITWKLLRSNVKRVIGIIVGLDRVSADSSR